MKWYQAERLSAHVQGIVDVTGTRCFLIEGETSALVVDTGVGAGDLKAYVAQMTSLPYTVMLTHGHVDHAGGAGWFDSVLLNARDIPLVHHHSTPENRRGYLAAAAPQLADSVVLAEAMTTACPHYLPLPDGESFDLGGLHVDMIAVPGHTQGMTCPLIREERMLILGDACNGRVFLFDEEASSVAAYQRSLQQLTTYAPLYDTALFSHGPAVQPKAMVQGCLDLTAEILAGEDDAVPFSFMGKQACMAKKVGADGISRIDGGIGNIVYNPQRKTS